LPDRLGAALIAVAGTTTLTELEPSSPSLDLCDRETGEVAE
jgi:hypothetical protein